MAKPMMIGHVPTQEELDAYELLKKEESEQPLALGATELEVSNIKNWVSAQDAASLLGMSTAMFQYLKRHNKLRGVRVMSFGRRQRFFGPDLLCKFKSVVRVL